MQITEIFFELLFLTTEKDLQLLWAQKQVCKNYMLTE